MSAGMGDLARGTLELLICRALNSGRVLRSVRSFRSRRSSNSSLGSSTVISIVRGSWR